MLLCKDSWVTSIGRDCIKRWVERFEFEGTEPKVVQSVGREGRQRERSLWMMLKKGRSDVCEMVYPSHLRNPCKLDWKHVTIVTINEISKDLVRSRLTLQILYHWLIDNADGSQSMLSSDVPDVIPLRLRPQRLLKQPHSRGLSRLVWQAQPSPYTRRHLLFDMAHTYKSLILIEPTLQMHHAFVP